MKLWIALIVLVVVMVFAQNWIAQTPTQPERKELGPALPESERKLEKATLTPGRVVELITNKGEIDFVLLDKDCPKTTRRIADLVKDGCYGGVKFERVEASGLIQTGSCKKNVAPMGLEVLKGLTNTKGAVGMARKPDRNSATSSFYILIEPWAHLDYDYTVFGRVIRGMDVAMRIKKNDFIKSAAIRPQTEQDRKQFYNVLKIESERKTQ